MNRFLTAIVFAVSLIVTLASHPQTPAPTKAQKAPLSLTERLLKFLGISNSPGTLKGPGDEVRSGELWIADLRSRQSRQLSSGDGYRSPIFLTPSGDVLALRGNEVVRFASGNLKPDKLYSIADISKLVASSANDPDAVLVLQRTNNSEHPRVGLLNVHTGTVTNIPYDPNSSRDLQMVEDLAGWRRTYGDRQVFVKSQSKDAPAGKIEWLDVFLQAGNEPPLNISHCDGDYCGQPSLSADGRSVVFVRARSE